VKYLIVLIAFLIPQGHPSFTMAEGETTKPSKDERLSRETADGTVRVFSIGVALANEQLIKMTALKISDEDMKHLLKKTKGLRSTPKEIKEFWASRKVKTLKPGDKFKLPDDTEIVVGEDEVSEVRMVVVVEDSPIPTRLYKVEGFWWVDPAPVIAGRKAAEEVKKGSEQMEKGSELNGINLSRKSCVISS
jgi:hypothetical protein